MHHSFFPPHRSEWGVVKCFPDTVFCITVSPSLCLMCLSSMALRRRGVGHHRALRSGQLRFQDAATFWTISGFLGTFYLWENFLFPVTGDCRDVAECWTWSVKVKKRDNSFKSLAEPRFNHLIELPWIRGLEPGGLRVYSTHWGYIYYTFHLKHFNFTKDSPAIHTTIEFKSH